MIISAGGDKEATLEECRHACELACADEFIDRFPKGYETYIEQGGTMYPEVRSRDYVLQEHLKEAESTDSG